MEQVLLMLQLIENEICYCALPVRELLKKIDSRIELADLTFVSDCREKYTISSDFALIWRESVRKSNVCLNAEDKNLLCSFGDALGTTDISGQINICRLHAKLFEERLEQAKQTREKQGKMYTNMGALTGVFLAVILF